MFGFSFWEIVVIAIVGVVVTGPKELPKMLRKLGQTAARLRRMATDLRVQSGIDEALHAEGLGSDIAEIRRLARGELTDVRALAASATSGLSLSEPAASQASQATRPTLGAYDSVPRGYGIEAAALQREYPEEGVDTRGALPDSANVYEGSFPESSFASSPLWLRGEEAPPTSDTGAPEADANANETNEVVS